MPTFTGQIGTGAGDINFSQELAGSTLAGSWQQYFDPYDWQKETAYGKQYQGALGGLFEKAGTGTMDLMSSWAGGGQTLSGRKLGQRKTLGKGTAYDAFKLGQGLDVDRYAARTTWEREQRSNLNTLLGMDIWEDQSSPSGTNPSSTWPAGTQTYLGESEFTGGVMIQILLKFEDQSAKRLVEDIMHLLRNVGDNV